MIVPIGKLIECKNKKKKFYLVLYLVIQIYKHIQVVKHEGQDLVNLTLIKIIYSIYIVFLKICVKQDQNKVG